MDPNNQANPYGFILNPQAPQRQNKFGGVKNKPLAIALFLLFVIVLLFASVAVFQSLTKKDYSPYVTLAAKQTEIVRITDIGISKSRNNTTKAYLATIRAELTSEKYATTNFLKLNKNKVSDKQLASKKDTATDKALTAAESTTHYDETLLQTINGLLVDYHKSVKAVGSNNGTKSERALVALLKSNMNILTKSAVTTN